MSTRRNATTRRIARTGRTALALICAVALCAAGTTAAGAATPLDVVPAAVLAGAGPVAGPSDVSPAAGTACADGIGIAVGVTIHAGGPSGDATAQQIGRIGDAIDYKVTVTASETDCPITDDTVTLTLPDGTVQTLGTGVSLNPGQSRSFDTRALGMPLYVIAPAQVDNGLVTASAATEGISHETNGFLEPASASTSYVVPVISPETSLTKAADVSHGTAPLTVTYTFTETNDSPDTFPGADSVDAISDTTVTDSNPDCTPRPTLSGSVNVGDTDGNGLLDIGEGWTYTCSVTYSEAGRFTDTAHATGNAGDGRPAGTPASNGAPDTEKSGAVTVVVDKAPPTPTPVINVVKSEPTPGDGQTVTPGQSDPITYHLELTNTGDAAATDVTVTDTIPDGTSYVAGSASCGTTPDCTVAYSSSEDAVTWTLSTVAAGADGTLSFQVSVNSSATETIVNRASFTDVNTPQCSAGPMSGTCWTNKVRNPLPAPTTPVINVVKSEPTPGDGQTVTPGQSDPITYHLELTNTGDGDASDVTVTDDIPDGTSYVAGSASCGTTPDCTVAYSSSEDAVTWTLSSVAAGADETLSFQVSVNGTATDTIVNRASFTDVNTPQCSAGPMDGTCWTNKVHNPLPPPTPTINVIKGETNPGDNRTVYPGKQIDYTLEVINTGDAAATDVTVTDAIPDGTSYVAGSASCGTAPDCTVGYANGTVTWTLSSARVGADETLTFSVTVTQYAHGTIVNQGSFTNINTPDCSAGSIAGTCLTNRVHNPLS